MCAKYHKVIQDVVDLAVDAFVDHELAWREDHRGHWHIRNNDHGFHWTEIISLRGGRLFVGGDIDDCTFGHFEKQRAGETTTNYHLRKLRWMGLNEDLEYYVLQKAEIGMTDSGLLTTAFYPEIAKDQVKQWRDEAEREMSYDTVYDLSLALSNIEDREIMTHHLYNADYWEEAGNVGMGPSSRVIYAWAAMNRLCQLLRLEK